MANELRLTTSPDAPWNKRLWVREGNGKYISLLIDADKAHFIVTAVNSHDALVEALKRLLEEHSCDDGSVDYKWSEGGCATCQQARAALKAAGVDAN
jgi:hypothetical protein